MEAYDIFRVLSLVIVWAIPAILLMAVAVFVIVAPTLTLGGVIARLYEVVGVRLRRRMQARQQGLDTVCSVNADCPPGFVCAEGHCVPAR